MKKVKVLTADKAVMLVKDGDTVSTGGFVGSGSPESLTRALEKRFLETGSPKNLTLFHAAGPVSYTHLNIAMTMNIITTTNTIITMNTEILKTFLT